MAPPQEPLPRPDAGLRSLPLQVALGQALRGRGSALDDLLARHGGLPGPRPNLKLAAAFGAEVAALPALAQPLLARLAQDDADADNARAFLPIAAAHGWAGLLHAGHDVDTAWAALALLAADHRAPVRVGTQDALTLLSVRTGGADTLVARASAWLDSDDPEMRFGTAALTLDVLGEGRVLAVLRDHAALLHYLSRVLDDLAAAPRSADRSDGRRRALLALPRTLGAVVSDLPGDTGQLWLAAECEKAHHPQLRLALSATIVRLRHTSRGQSSAVSASLRQALEGSAKPLRDPTRVRPGTGRGKGTRRIR